MSAVPLSARSAPPQAAVHLVAHVSGDVDEVFRSAPGYYAYTAYRTHSFAATLHSSVRHELAELHHPQLSRVMIVHVHTMSSCAIRDGNDDDPFANG